MFNNNMGNMGMNPAMMMMMMNNMNNNMGMGMNNMGMGMMNVGSDDWMKGFEMGMKENSEPQQVQEPPGPKITVIFKTTQGTVTNMPFKHGTTIGEALKMYLKRVGRPDLINNLQDRLCFLVNAKQLKFDNTTKIEEFFKNTAYPTVLVNDVNNLIGAQKHFKITSTK